MITRQMTTKAGNDDTAKRKSLTVAVIYLKEILNFVMLMSYISATLRKLNQKSSKVK